MEEGGLSCPISENVNLFQIFYVKKRIYHRNQWTMIKIALTQMYKFVPVENATKDVQNSKFVKCKPPLFFKNVLVARLKRFRWPRELKKVEES